MSIVTGLKALPLFQGISEARLAQLVSAFRPATHKANTVLFRPGDLATHFELLVKGEVTIEEEGAQSSNGVTARFQLRPISPLGELGALTHIPRSTTATSNTDVELLTIGVGDLLGFFDRHGEIGQAFYRNLLGVVSDKVRRDRRLLGEMRQNIIRTQKAMKQMRETVLAAPETEISRPVHDTLDVLIDNNRRANYRVMPTPTYPAAIRLDSGHHAPILEISEGYMKIEGASKDATNDPSFWSGVLVTPTDELVVSGQVIREDNGAFVVKLDKLIDEYKTKLDDYTTRVQLLDFVV